MLVHGVGHSQRRALRGSKGVGRECRSHSLCTPVQINDKGPPCRQAWQGPSYSERPAARRMGTSKSNRRKPHSGTTHNPYGLCVEEWRHVLGGESVGFILVDAPSDGAIHKEVPIDLSRSMLLWIRVQETHSYTYSCGVDKASLWHLPGSRRAQASTRGLVGEDTGFLPRPTTTSLENSFGRGIPSPPVLVVGRRSRGVRGKARGQGEPLETDDEEGRRQQAGQERSAGCGRAPEWAREERVGKQEGVGRTAKPSSGNRKVAKDGKAGGTNEGRNLAGHDEARKGAAKRFRGRQLRSCQRAATGDGRNSGKVACRGVWDRHPRETSTLQGRAGCGAGQTRWRPRDECRSVDEGGLSVGHRGAIGGEHGIRRRTPKQWSSPEASLY